MAWFQVICCPLSFLFLLISPSFENWYDTVVYTVVNFVISLSTKTGSFMGQKEIPFLSFSFPVLLKSFLHDPSTFSHHLPGEQSHGHNLTFTQPYPPRTVMRLSFSHTSADNRCDSSNFSAKFLTIDQPPTSTTHIQTWIILRNVDSYFKWGHMSREE